MRTIEIPKQTKPGRKQMTPPMLRLSLPARPENIAVVRHALAGLAAELGGMPELVDDIKTAVSEAATNAIVHAYPEGEEGALEVSARVNDGRRLEIVLRDRGIGMQPRPVSMEEPSLRVGLALIGAVADGFEVRGEQGEGTEVRITFDLDRDGDGDGVYGPTRDLPLPEREATHLAVNATEPGSAAIPKVLELLAARANLSLDRLSDTQLLGDYLSYWSSRATADSMPLEVSIVDSDGAIDVRIGPLEQGRGREMLERGTLPGLGNTLERIAENIDIEEENSEKGPVEYLTLQVRE